MELKAQILTRRGVAALITAGIVLGGGAIAEAAGTVKVKPGNYKGTTSENIAVTFKIKGRTIKNFSTSIGYSGACGQGGGPGYTIKANRVHIKANGKFAARVTLVGPVKSVKSVKGSLTGKAKGRAVSGKIVDLALKHAKCNGYTETFSANRT